MVGKSFKSPDILSISVMLFIRSIALPVHGTAIISILTKYIGERGCCIANCLAANKAMVTVPEANTIY